MGPDLIDALAARYARAYRVARAVWAIAKLIGGSLAWSIAYGRMARAQRLREQLIEACAKRAMFPRALPPRSLPS